MAIIQGEIPSHYQMKETTQECIIKYSNPNKVAYNSTFLSNTKKHIIDFMNKYIFFNDLESSVYSYTDSI